MSPRFGRGFEELLPKIARVRVSARTLLVVPGIICVQRTEMRGFTPYYQDTFAIVSPSLPCASSRTRTRAFFGSISAKPLSNSSSSHQPNSNPLANSSAAHRLNPDPLASTSPVHRPEPTLLPTTPQTVRPKPAPYQQPSGSSLSQQPFESSVQAKLPTNGSRHIAPSQPPLPVTLQAIGPIPSPHQHSPEPSTRCGRTARRSSLLRLRHSLALGRTDRPRALAAMRATSSIFDSLIICWPQTVTTLIP